MSDAGAVLRVFDELLWRLRREGFEISAAQAIDAARAVQAVGLEKGSVVREAVACVVVQSVRERARFDAVFDGFFGRHPSRGHGTLWERLRTRGFEDAELDALRAALEHVASSRADGVVSFETLLDRGADLDRQLALTRVTESIDAHSGQRLGFRTYGLLAKMGVGPAREVLAGLSAHLVDALGVRGRTLAEALASELEGAEDDIRALVRRAYEARVADSERERAERRIETAPFTSLSDAEVEEVRLAVRRFAERLRGSARVRARRALRGRIDPHETLRRALRTGGVPYRLARKKVRRDRPKIVLLCDVSDSVRAVACFLLEFTYAAQELFEQTRSFVFVSELAETTELFAQKDASTAIAHAWLGGALVRPGENSNYGRVLRTFEARHLRELDAKTTVVILGDGRNNYHDPAAEVLSRIRKKARALVWLCPEPQGEWQTGDSAMSRYARECSAVYQVRSARDLRTLAAAARRLSSLPVSRPSRPLS